MANNVTDIAFTDIVNNSNTTGYFNELMASIKGHINEEYQAGRIIGNDYANVFLGSMQYAMNNAIQYALQKHVQDQQAELLAAQASNAIAEGLNIPKQGVLLDAQGLEVAASTVRQDSATTAQNALLVSQTTLTTNKSTTETKQQTVLDKQATLYVNQAKAFEGKHNKELLKVLTDTWIVASSESLANGGEHDPLNESKVFGETLGPLVNTSKWSALTTG